MRNWKKQMVLSLLLAALSALPAHAVNQRDELELLIRDDITIKEAAVDVDECVDMTSEYTEVIRLVTNIYKGQDYRILIKTDGWTTPFIECESEQLHQTLRRIEHDGSCETAYYLLTISSERLEEDKATEDIRITVQCGGITKILRTLLCDLPTTPLYSGMNVFVQNRPFVEFCEKFEEAAVVECAKGLNIVLKGDYGEQAVNLSVKCSEMDGAILYHWEESSTFDRTVTVKLRGEPDSKVYEMHGGRTYLVETTFDNGWISFQTDYLCDYMIC